jgi:hypothetical protein
MTRLLDYSNSLSCTTDLPSTARLVQNPFARIVGRTGPRQVAALGGTVPWDFRGQDHRFICPGNPSMASTMRATCQSMWKRYPSQRRTPQPTTYKPPCSGLYGVRPSSEAGACSSSTHRPVSSLVQGLDCLGGKSLFMNAISARSPAAPIAKEFKLANFWDAK